MFKIITFIIVLTQCDGRFESRIMRMNLNNIKSVSLSNDNPMTNLIPQIVIDYKKQQIHIRVYFIFFDYLIKTLNTLNLEESLTNVYICRSINNSFQFNHIFPVVAAQGGGGEPV